MLDKQMCWSGELKGSAFVFSLLPSLLFAVLLGVRLTPLPDLLTL